ncbi:MAG TPA: SIS domain-containing protein [Acidimicrobiales bacterium]|nr:SIS domain-containing protein [Acidimicrobiales bacterium]
MTTTYDSISAPVDAPRARAKFPTTAYGAASPYVDAYFDEWAGAAGSIDQSKLDEAATILLEAYSAGAHVFSCGNGGSASIANHLECDHLKGVRTRTDLAPRVHSLSANIELITAVANDIGYEDVFVYQLQSHARPGDVLVAISSSGRSPNIIRALTWARDNDLRTIALTGFSGGEARSAADVALHVDSTNYGIIEDLHQTMMHALAQYVRQSRMTADSIAITTF